MSILDQDKAEASVMVTTAKEQAERIRRDSERELAAATARRDSITAQLSNVRSMLGTLGGASSIGQAESAGVAVPDAAPLAEVEAPTETEAEAPAEAEAEAEAEVEAPAEADVEPQPEAKPKANSKVR